MNEQHNRTMREGDTAATGPATIVVEKHKDNFLALAGSFQTSILKTLQGG